MSEGFKIVDVLKQLSPHAHIQLAKLFLYVQDLSDDFKKQQGTGKTKVLVTLGMEGVKFVIFHFHIKGTRGRLVAIIINKRNIKTVNISDPLSFLTYIYNH